MKNLTRTEIAAIESDPTYRVIERYDSTGSRIAGDADHEMRHDPSNGAYVMISRSTTTEVAFRGRLFETEEEARQAWARLWWDGHLRALDERKRDVAHEWRRKHYFALAKVLGA